MSGGKKVHIIDPSTGETKEVAPVDAQDAFVAGKAHLPAGSTVTLTRDNQVMDFGADKVQTALEAGWSMADRHQVLAAEARNQQVQAALEGAAAGLTGRLTDLVGSQLGLEGIAERRETGPGQMGEWGGTGLSIVGTLGAGGAAGAAVKTGAAGLASKAAAGALAPTRALMAAGNAAERAGAGALAKLGASSVASRIGGQVIGRGLEGATVGAIGGMAEESLGNPEANAAQLLAAGGMGALVGGAFGGITGGAVQGLSEGLGRLARGKPSVVAATGADVAQALESAGMPKPDRALTERFADWAVSKVKGAAKAAYDVGNKVAVKAGGFDATDVAAVNSPEYQAFIRQGERGIHESAERLGAVIDDVTRQAKVAEQHMPRRPAVDELARQLPVEKAADAVDAAGRHINEFRNAFRNIADNEEMLGLGAGGAKRVLGKSAQAVDELENRVFALTGADKVYRGTVSRTGVLGEIVDSQVTKQRSLREVAGLFEIPPEAAAESFATMSHLVDTLRTVKSANPAVKAEIGELVKSLETTLSDTNVFGETANTVKALTTAREARDGALALMKGKLRFTETGTVDRGSLAAYIRNITSLDGEDGVAVTAVQRWITAQQEVVSNTAKLVREPARMGAEVAAIGSPSKLASQFEVAHEVLSSKAMAFNALDRLTKQKQDQIGAGAGPLGYAVTGLVHGAVGMLGAGPAGHIAAGIGLQAAMDPARAAVMLSRSGEAIEKARVGFTAAVNKVMGLPAKALPTTGPRGANIARTTTRLLEAKTDGDRRAAFRDRLAEVAEMNSIEHSMARNMRVMSVGEHMPNTAAAVDAKAAFAAQLLLASVPAPRPTPGGLQYHDPAYSDDAIRRFMRLDRAIQDPMGILARAAEGQLTKEDLTAWHSVYPELRDATRASVMEAMADGHEMSRTQEELMLRLTSDDTSGRPAHLRRLQALHTASQPAPKRPSSASPRAPKAGMSAADKLL